MDCFWMVYRDGQGCTAPTYRHPSPGSAEKEAERLAIANPGYSFYVMCAYKKCEYKTVSWETADYDIPF